MPCTRSDLYVIHERLMGCLLDAAGVRLADEIGERGSVEHAGNSVAHFPHDDTSAAVFHVLTFLAGLECGLAGAGERRQRSFNDANDGAYRDSGWRPAELVAAVPSQPAVCHSAAFHAVPNCPQVFPCDR